MANPHPTNKKKLRDKKRVYDYWQEHPGMSYAKVGRVFHIHRSRVGQIVQQYRNGAD